MNKKQETRNKKQETRNKKQETDTCCQIKSQVGVDLCYVESRLVDICSCLCVRYDAGICRHKMEHTGVLVVYE